jgi:ethanolamine utilization microcompartment shell protein EutL
MTIALAEYTICKVASVSGVDLKTAGKTVLYTVPSGKTFYPVAVVVRDASASLAGGTDYDFGTGANADTWVQAVDLSAMTTPDTDFKVIDSGGTKYTKCAAGSEFGVKVITGSTAAATAVIDVFGFLA